MIKSFARRHWIAGLLFVVSIGAMGLPRHYLYSTEVAAMPARQSPLKESTTKQSLLTEPALTASEKVDTFTEAIREAMTQLDNDLAHHKQSKVKKYLAAIQIYQQQILSIVTELSTSQKAQLAQMCTAQTKILQPNLYIMLESDQLDGTLVLANYLAIQRAVEK